VEHRAEVDALVNGWAENLTAKEAVDQLNQASVPGALLYNFADIEADENFTVHRQMIKHMEHPIIGDIPYINIPIRFQESGLVEPKAAGSLGQFNEEIYGQYLGLGKEDLEELKANGII
jgi:crotonobetainyl-CoA:carnitine CoA-transferase CaiB-like acyl-CoA transferase